LSKDPDEKQSSYREVAVAIVIAAITAAIGYTVTFIDEHRKSELQNVNIQIEKLYGPLYSYSIAARRAHDELRSIYRNAAAHYFNKDDKDPPTAEEVEVWRRWMKTVFMLINERMERVIIDNVQLIDGDRIYPPFSDLIMHVESYKAVVTKWKESDDLSNITSRSFSENNALIEYPIDVDSCIEKPLDAALALREKIENSLTGYFITGGNESFPEGCS
jgi:hypothetical protein